MKRTLCSLFLVLLCAVGRAQVSFGQAEQFNEGWLFSLTDNTKAAQSRFDDSDWRKLSLPHDWSIEGQPSQQWASCTGYLPAGVAWYRKHFQLSSPSALTYIYFEGIYNRSEVYLNGHLLGKRPNGYVSFMYELTPYLRKGDNVIAVRVDHSRYADSRWYTGSGIYRDVWLIHTPKVHLAQWGTTYRLEQLDADGSAKVEVDVTVEGLSGSLKRKGESLPPPTREGESAYAVRLTLSDANGNVIDQKSHEAQANQTLHLRVPKAHLWNLNAPYLYTLKVELEEAGHVIDQTEIPAGLRTLRFDSNDGFFLNDQPTKIKGVCLHHDAGVLGAAVPREVWVRKVKELKRMGANAIRMSHNPQAPVLYDICDQMGILVIDEGSDEWEFPKRKWVEGWNQGQPTYEGSYDYFEEWIERDVADMVRRDRNHPSVFLWSVGNEVDYPNDPYSHPVLDGGNATINQPMFGGYKPDAPNAERIGQIAKRIAAVIRGIDTSRPVTGALAGVVMSNQTEYPEAIDVVGYNYTENRYDTDHEQYPQRIIYGSETGVGYDAWKAVRDRKHIFGQFVWTGTDYLGESGRWPSRGLNTGLLDFGSFRKPRGWFRAALWSEEPVCYIGAYPLQSGRNGRRRGNFMSPEAPDDWNWKEGTIRVVCYTNAPQARLLLNGREVGEPKPIDDATGIIHWDIPYEPGTLRAEGCDKEGRIQSAYEIHTTGEPAALRVTELLPEDCDRLHQLLIEVLDSKGNRIHSAHPDIACALSGPATLLGLENSNNADMSPPRDNHRPAHRGRLVAYIRRTGPGPVSLTFSAGDLSITYPLEK